jgi:hypothetical protein
MKSVTTYYNKTQRLRQMSRKLKRIRYQLNKEAVSLLKEIYSNQVAVPSSFSLELLYKDSELEIEDWEQILVEFDTWAESQRKLSTGVEQKSL